MKEGLARKKFPFFRRSATLTGLSTFFALVAGVIVVWRLDSFIAGVTDSKHHNLFDLVGLLFLEQNQVEWNFYFWLVAVWLLGLTFWVVVVEHYIKLLIYRLALPDVVKEFNLLKLQIQTSIKKLVEGKKDQQIAQLQPVYVDLLRQMRAEFDLDGIDVKTIWLCTDQLAEIIKQSKPIKCILALADLQSSDWLTRTMLIYLIRTVQIADKVPNGNKLRVFLKSSGDSDVAYDQVSSLHDGFLPIQTVSHVDFVVSVVEKHPDLAIPEKPAFLYLDYEDGSKLFWHIFQGNSGLQWVNNATSIPPEYAPIIAYVKDMR